MAELDPDTLSGRRRRRIGASIATGTALVLALLLLKECGPGGPAPSGPTGAEVEVSAGPVGGEGARVETLLATAGPGGSQEAGAETRVGSVTSGPSGAGVPPSGVSAAPPGRGEVARVETLLGTATAGPPGGARRALACTDIVFRGEVVSTSPDSRAGLMRGDVYAQLGSNSSVAVDLTPAGALDVELAAGAVRVVDARTAGPPVRVSALGATAELVGGDADAYRPAGSSGARICTRGRPLSIAGAAGSATAAPNQCVLAAPDATLAVAAPPPARLALPQSAAEECYDFRAAIAAFTPGTVGAGPDDWLVPAWYQGGPERSPCDDPGSGCSAVTAKASKKKPSIKHPTHPTHPNHPKNPNHPTHPTHPNHPLH